MPNPSWWHSLNLRIWSVPASAWALFAGTLAGLAFNLLITVRVDSDLTASDRMWFALAFAVFLVSAFCFGWVAVLLEECRGSGDLEHFRLAIQGAPHRRRLLRASVAAFGTLAVAVALFFVR